MPSHRALALGLFLVVLAAGCASLPGGAAPTATPVTAISRERAIEIGTQMCQTKDMVLVSAPRNIQAQLVTLNQGRPTPPPGITVTTASRPGAGLAWQVQLDGQLQLIGGPEAPNVTAAPPTPFAGTCTALLDAATGEWIGTTDVPLAAP